MKKLKNLGRSLTKQEMRSLVGGFYAPEYEGGGGTMICACLGSGSAMDEVACAFHSLSGFSSCYSGSRSYCTNTYGGGTECSMTYSS
jgi:hypothetical protein